MDKEKFRQYIIELLTDYESPLDRCNAVIDNDDCYAKIAADIIAYIDQNRLT